MTPEAHADVARLRMQLRPTDGFMYGAMGLPLAFVALPLYVTLPAHYGQTLGVPLAALGAVMLGSRLLDAVADPLIGRWADGLLARRARTGHAHPAWQAMAAAAAVLALGFAALYAPPALSSSGLLWWCALSLSLTCLAFSACTILHLAWAGRLGGNASSRAHWVAWREGMALAGVLLANGVAASQGPLALITCLCITLVLAVLALRWAPSPSFSSSPGQPPNAQSTTPHAPLPAWQEAKAAFVQPWRHAEFSRLMGLFLFNGVASAIPATLVLFFIQDVLQRPDLTAQLLGCYFVCAALGVPLWVRLIGRIGPSRAWALGMAGQVLAFAGVMLVGPGDTALFVAVCMASGLMLGADLTAPGTLLSGVMQRAAASGSPGTEGVFAGWWQLANKLNLALAAGLALPALAWLGYSPGLQTAPAQAALTWLYGLLPCVCKCLAILLWWRLWARKGLE